MRWAAPRSSVIDSMARCAASRIVPPGVYLDESERTPETIAARFAEISDPKTAEPLKDAFSQTMKFVAAAAKARGVKLD